MKNKVEFLDHIKKIGITFDQFNKEADERATNPIELIEDEFKKKLHGYTILNQRRTARILKSYKPSDEVKNAVSKITDKQTWLIITEDWCGDSAQIIPHLYKMTELNPNIEFKIVYRDANTDIIDKYLTNGGRAIPKIVALNSEGYEILQCGPRPYIAQQLFIELKESGKPKEEISEKIQLWYSRDRGKTLEKELIKLLIK